MKRDPNERLTTVCRLLNAAKARYAIVGGYAVAMHGVVRATKDVDVLIDPTLKNAQRVLSALEELPFRMAGDIDPADVIARKVTIIGDIPNVDLLTIAWSVRYADAAAGLQKAVVDGVRVPYVSFDDLVRSKQTGRLQDRADIEALERLRALEKGLDDR